MEKENPTKDGHLKNRVDSCNIYTKEGGEGARHSRKLFLEGLFGYLLFWDSCLFPKGSVMIADTTILPTEPAVVSAARRAVLHTYTTITLSIR